MTKGSAIGRVKVLVVAAAHDAFDRKKKNERDKERPQSESRTESTGRWADWSAAPICRRPFKAAYNLALLLAVSAIRICPIQVVVGLRR